MNCGSHYPSEVLSFNLFFLVKTNNNFGRRDAFVGKFVCSKLYPFLYCIDPPLICRSKDGLNQSICLVITINVSIKVAISIFPAIFTKKNSFTY